MPKARKKGQVSPKLPNSQLLQGAEYIYDYEKGLRRVKPYYFEFKTWVKGRWLGKTLTEIFTTEFRDRDTEYYKQAIIDGKVKVNGEPSHGDLILKNGDVLTHVSHRHEPPVSLRPVQIVHCDDDLIVINKPAGVPVHPAGRYRHNSVLNIMSIEQNFATTIAPCNRLDRLTSGLMFFAQHASAAEKMCQYLFDRELTKEYLARVVGDFPEGDIIVDQPLKSVNPMYGLNRVHPDGKPSKSMFRKLSYNGVTSLVWCRPYSGRTHQLRVHLQWLGHPIANDPIYANRRVWGEDMTQVNGKTDEEVENKLLHLGRSQVADFGEFAPAETGARLITEGPQHDFVTINTKAESIAKREKRIGELLTGDECGDCGAPLYSDPTQDELLIFLHALSYSADDGSWAYKTEEPEWAAADWSGVSTPYSRPIETAAPHQCPSTTEDAESAQEAAIDEAEIGFTPSVTALPAAAAMVQPVDSTPAVEKAETPSHP